MALNLLDQARAIVWAQWRTVVNFYPRSSRLTVGASFLLTVGWYAGWCAGAIAMAAKIATLADLRSAQTNVGYGLLLGFFYWQVVPLLLATAGVSLEIKKLIVYPVPHSQLFLLDAMLRVSTGLEVIIMIAGATAGILLNPRLPWWSSLAFLPYIAFNLAFAAGIRELLARIMARRFLREIAMLLLVVVGALPQFLLLLGNRVDGVPGMKLLPMLTQFQQTLSQFLPWIPTAAWAMGRFSLLGFAVILFWTVGAWVFGRWQFERGLRFDAAAAQTAQIQNAPPSRWTELLFTWPGRIFKDPLAAMIEKELRSLIRTPRFRLVFFMGFSFGLLLWMPMLMRANGSVGFFRDNYLTFVAVYALLLLGDVCLWNVFGFDRSAAQAYLVTPVQLRSAFLAKNLTALTFVLLEVTIVGLVCLVFRLPLSLAKALPAYLISTLMTFTLMSAGNLTSVYYPQPMNPQKTLRSRPAARTQGLLMLIFLVAGGMSGLAYLAEYAFDSRVAFYSVLVVLAIVVGITYRISLDSAVEAAYSRRELLIAALSQNDAPVSA
jgi:ABC-2 type transport system permease protein